MNQLLQYPFDASVILRKRKSIKKDMQGSQSSFVKKKIAILGGSTTHDIKEILELFLLDHGIQPEFFESGYGQFWQTAMFDPAEFLAFSPDVIYIHTCNRNIQTFPEMSCSEEEIDQLLDREFQYFHTMWEHLKETYHCPIIQNNFEYLNYRILGNKDASDLHGRNNYILRLNALFSQYARQNSNFFINDIHYLSAQYGLDKWSEPTYWYLYKYALNVSAIPLLAHNLGLIIKSIYGKNKKAIVVDLDNTLWGGVIGDDGLEGIAIGLDNPVGYSFSEFQTYLKLLKGIGVLLAVSSKNELQNAKLGLTHPDSVLRPEDFLTIMADWNRKDEHITRIAKTLNIFTDSIVFVDDNPVERQIVAENVPDVSLLEWKHVEDAISLIDKSGYFETTYLTQDDIQRNKMYIENQNRINHEHHFEDYNQFLHSLQMKATIADFDALYLQRITQLINKTNQFNVTTKRYSAVEISEISNSDQYLRLYGRLRDKFGDNGIVTVMIGKKENSRLHLDVWLMSCRVLNRKMEHAMLDKMVACAQKEGIKEIVGYYIPTAKNGLVSTLFGELGFAKIADIQGQTTWVLNVQTYSKMNDVIQIIEPGDLT